jgi:transmembrane sensor
MTLSDRAKEEALAWLVRTNDPEFADWAAFTSWLEEDPGHADAYHRLVESEQLVLPVLHAGGDQQDNVPEAAEPRRRRPMVIGTGLLLAGIVAAFTVLQPMAPDVYRTGPGEHRRIVLARGDEVLLNGSSQVEISGWKRRDVRVHKGQALFRLAGSERLEVRTGDLTVVDIGTVFAVTRHGVSSRVVVDEGAVLVEPDSARLELARGEQLIANDGTMRLIAVPAPSGAAGAWTRGQLTYLQAPISEVAADLARSTGLAISVAIGTGAQRFSGTLSIADIRRDPRKLEPLLQVPVRPQGKGWMLGEDR